LARPFWTGWREQTKRTPRAEQRRRPDSILG
jgi:hypothetical protein